MILLDARAELIERVNLINSEYSQNGVQDYKDALLLAIKCIDAQMELTELLNELIVDFKPEDRYSARLTIEMLLEGSIFKEDYLKDINLKKVKGV